MSAASKSIAIITGSTRVPRVGPSVAGFVKDLLEEDEDTLKTPAGSPITLHHVNVADFNLPSFNEPIPSAQIKNPDDYKHEHTRAWAREIQKYDAYFVVTAEYNYGIPGGLKNAIDYVMNEWTGKPVAIVSYGIGGGHFASDQTDHVLSHMKLRVAPTRPQLAFGDGIGPAAYSALGGTLAEESRKRWTEGKKDDILKAFAEVRELLDQEPPAAEQ